jgi:hypothetical protein
MTKDHKFRSLAINWFTIILWHDLQKRVLKYYSLVHVHASSLI